MRGFQFIGQESWDNEYQGFCITEFRFDKQNNLTEELMVDQFIHNSYLTSDSLREIVKQNPGKPFLRQAFNTTKISAHDFKKLTKQQLLSFLKNFEDEENWGDNDKENFIKVKSRFLSKFDSANPDSLYLINKDWYDKNDVRLREPENWIFIYYFLLLWIDYSKSTLTLCEWIYE
jgi:hypothetical protein